MLKQLFSVFLQSPCLLCDRPSATYVCQYCLQGLSKYQFSNEYRLRLQRNLSVFAWGKYDGQLKRAIACLKYNNKPEIGTLLGQLLGRAWLDSGLDRSLLKVTIVPIPMHRSKLKARGFNQAEVIAKSFCRTTGYSLNSQAIVRTKATKAMFELSPEERKNNLRSAFQVGDRLPKAPVLLLDDIYTTGTTTKEVTKILQQHVKVLGAVVIAKTDDKY